MLGPGNADDAPQDQIPLAVTSWRVADLCSVQRMTSLDEELAGPPWIYPWQLRNGDEVKIANAGAPEHPPHPLPR